MNKIFYVFFLCSGLITSLQAQTPAATSRPSATPVKLPSAYSGTVNYIRIWQPGISTTDINDVISTSHTTKEVKQATQYFDGLGRPLQTVAKGMSGTADINVSDGKDMVIPATYDAQGREQIKYLPYVQQTGNTSDGKFKTDPFNAQKSFYQNNILNPGIIGESIYYQQAEYETSPLNRVLKTFAPGNSWAKEGGNHPVQNQYLVNTIADSVYIWSMSSTNEIPTSGGIYPAGELFKNVMIDESGSQIVEFKDKEEHVVFKKVQLSNTPGTAHMGWLCTYYVYDNAGSLRFVMSPKAVDAIKGVWSVPADVAAELCFIYRYDFRGRLIIKKVPGADYNEMVYDVRDRLVFSRDGNMKAQGNWQVTFYDVLNRPVMTALYNAPATTRESLQGSMNTATSNGTTISYTFPGIADLVLGNYDGKALYQATNSITMQSGFETAVGTEVVMEINSSVNGGTQNINVTNPLPGIPASALTPLTYTFYDKYDYAGKLDYVSGDVGKPQAGANPNAETLPSSPGSMTQGMQTGVKLRVLNTDDWVTTSTYYNDKGRMIQTVSSSAAGGKDISTNLYDFKGKLLSTYLRHTNPRSATNPETRILTLNQYDHGGRLVSVKKQLNDLTSLQRTVTENTYDELGNLKTKRLGVTGSSTQLETLTYEYNIRGWLQGINKGFVNGSGSNWFGQELNYDFGFSTNQYDGNIAGIKWKSGTNNKANAYGYSYDRANRLTNADFRQLTGSSWSNATVDFSVSNLTYDHNGNIGTMNQKGMIGATPSMIDQLTYLYRNNSNKLAIVNDPINTTSAQLGDFINGNSTGWDYQYDTTGSLIKDLNKGIAAVSYNHLKLPQTITVTNKGSISYLYDATGAKLRKTVVDNTGSESQTTVTDYINGFVYENDVLKFSSHEDGRIRTVFKTGAPVSYAFDYFIKDHLGNIRMVLTDQSDFSMYTATMEAENAAVETTLFSNVDESRTAKPAGYPTADNSAEKNAYVAKLNGKEGGKKIGPSLALKVMAGDTIQIGTRAFYKSQGPKDSKNPAPVEDMVAGLARAFANGNSSGDMHAEAVNNNTPFTTDFYSNNYQRLKQKDPEQNIEGRPRAYLNYVLFDEQFNLVQDNSGVKQVKGEADELQTLAVDKMPIEKSGFMYIYTSNETQQDVYFDNVAVNLINGPVLEETHYYPFGLAMSGLSSNALRGTDYTENKYKFTGQLLDNELGWDNYQMKWRSMDPQIGRFLQIDPLASDYVHNSTYAYAENRVTNGVDLEGLEWSLRVDAGNVTHVNANVNISVREGLTLSPEQIAAYKQAISNQLNKTLNAVSDGSTTGSVTYEGGNAEASARAIPSIELYGKASAIGGETTASSATVNVFDTQGNLRSPESVGIDGVHELLHTLRLEHPHELTQAPDTKLVKGDGPNLFKSTPTTDPKIGFNIMNYPYLRIDGQRLGDLWKTSGQKPSRLTKGQLNIIMKEIKLQLQGSGARKSKDYQIYWFSLPDEGAQVK